MLFLFLFSFFTCLVCTNFFFFFFDRLEIKIEAFYLYQFFYFLLLRRAMRFSSNKFFVVACFCYAACFSWQLSYTNTYLFNASISRVFATWPHQESLPWSCASICSYTEAMPTFIFAMKQYLHLHLLWSHTIICLCNEVVLALFFFHKATSTFYLHWGHIYTSFIPKLCQHSFCHEATTTLHLHWSRANVQHFIRTETMKLRQQFIFARWQHSTLILKSCQYLFLPQNHVNTSYAPMLCQHSSLSWNHDNTPH